MPEIVCPPIACLHLLEFACIKTTSNMGDMCAWNVRLKPDYTPRRQRLNQVRLRRSG
jgi:hypothetical protein